MRRGLGTNYPLNSSEQRRQPTAADDGSLHLLQEWSIRRQSWKRWILKRSEPWLEYLGIWEDILADSFATWQYRLVTLLKHVNFTNLNSWNLPFCTWTPEIPVALPACPENSRKHFQISGFHIFSALVVWPAAIWEGAEVIGDEACPPRNRVIIGRRTTTAPTTEKYWDILMRILKNTTTEK